MKKSENTPTGEKPVNVKKELFGWVVYIAIIIAISFLIVKFVGMRTTVSGSSMNNTLYNGDQLIINKIGYRLHKPERFDIIVFPYQYKKDTYYIKRVIGLPGETVQIKEVDGNGYYVFINGKQLKSDVYGREVMNMPGLAENPIKLGEDEYFVLGDNRNNSEDSRFPDVAEIKGKDIVGKAFFRIYPFKDFGLIKHK
ncbi:MAG: signal peptidase I [Lachnospiraceae bacterium]|nr:signal peptidase I [Lachnospiraceae bacterium]